MNISDVHCLILAGGYGIRIKHLLPPDTPKFLAPINGKPFADYLIQSLHKQGIRRITLALSHLRKPIIEYVDSIPNYTKIIPRTFYPTLSYESIFLDYVYTKEPVGVEKTIQRALKSSKFNYKPEIILVVNGDTLFSRDFLFDEPLKLSGKSRSTVVKGTNFITGEKQLNGVRYISCRNKRPEFYNSSYFTSLGHFLDIGTPKGYAAAPEYVKTFM
ncbi:MAG TPA: NTP transferase domain-containing protein [Bacteroidia bacterium]|nr:NTP transferase domain-containing protein [Bacteroidia bacterium]